MRLSRKYSLSLAIQTRKIEGRLKGKVTVMITIDLSAKVSIMPKTIAERAKLII
jgi:hypothetical protein